MIEVEQRLERSAEQIRTAASRVPVPARLTSPGEQSPRRNRLLAVAAVAALTVGGLVVLVQTTDTDSPPATQPPASTPTRPPATPPVARGESGPGTWQQMAAAPIGSRVGAAAVSTGDEWVVWGGRADGVHADGAAYSFGDDTWRTMAPSPLSPRTDAIVVWTGEEVVIFGGTNAAGDPRFDAAAWNPATGEWRPLGEFPFSAVAGQTAVAWTGEELVLVGVIAAANVFLPSDTFAIDPTSGDQRTLDPWPEPPPGEGETFVPRARRAVFTGSEVLVISIADGFPVTIDRLDPVDGMWGESVVTSSPGLDVGPDGVVWTGSESVIVNHLSEGTVFDPATGEQAPIPTSNSVIRFPAVVVGGTVFVGDRWLDLASREWHDAAEVPEPLREFPVATADDGRAYVWGGDACGPAASCTGAVDPGPGLVWTPGP